MYLTDGKESANNNLQSGITGSMEDGHASKIKALWMISEPVSNR